MKIRKTGSGFKIKRPLPKAAKAPKEIRFLPSAIKDLVKEMN
jgi:hypothetical protein